MSDKSNVDWNIDLNFDIPKAEVQQPQPPAPKLSARETLKQKVPDLLTKIDRLWCTLELNRFFENTLFPDTKSEMQFPPDVIAALGETQREHRRMLIINGLLHRDVWDMQIGDTLTGKRE
jgi:hypothetical protein